MQSLYEEMTNDHPLLFTEGGRLWFMGERGDLEYYAVSEPPNTHVRAMRSQIPVLPNYVGTMK